MTINFANPIDIKNLSPLLGTADRWVPIGFRGRAAPSGNAYDTTNSYVMDQQMYQAPDWGTTTAIKAVYSGFDMDGYGEMLRAPTAAIKASIVNRAGPTLFQTTSADAAIAATSISFSETQGASIKRGMLVNTAGKTPAGCYVTSNVPTFNASGVVQGFTVNLSAAVTTLIPSGTNIGFSVDISDATFGGQPTGVLIPRYDYLVSDEIGVNLLPDQAFSARTYSTLSAPGVILQGGTSGYDVQVTGDACQRTTTANDLTLSPNAPTHTGSGYFGPIGFMAKVSSWLPSLLVLGDSIASGVGDNTPDAFGRCGFIQRSLTNKMPWLSLARPGMYVNFMNKRMTGEIAALKLGHFTDVIIEWCRNDLTGISAATTKTALGQCAAPFIAAGIRVWVCTSLPTTTSTDSWATLANQTISNANEAQRLIYNADIRANFASYGYTGLIDIAAIVESSASPGKFNVTGGAWTPDGIHPSGLAVTNIVNAGILTPAMFPLYG